MSEDQYTQQLNHTKRHRKRRAMRKEVQVWYSHRVGKNMPIVTYGHFGFPLLLFPTAAADFEEYERFLLIDVLAPWIERGKVKVYSIDSVNNYTWMNNRIHPSEMARRHEYYDAYVCKEVVPFIWNNLGAPQRIITSGASMGAFHAANFLFRHPDLFGGTVAMSGAYDLTPWTGGYMDENVYFNSPLHYIPNLHDHWYLSRYRRSAVHIVTGQGAYEDPDQSRKLSRVLWDKAVPNNLDLWGHDIEHDWPTWRKMLPFYVDRYF